MTTTKKVKCLTPKQASKRAPKELHDAIKNFRLNRANKRSNRHFGVPA